MVDDINFPKGMPPVSASGRVQRVNRKKREEERPPFEKFFDEEDQEDKSKKKKKKRDKVDIRGKTNKRHVKKYTESSTSTDAEETQDNSEQKGIDIRV